MYRKLVLVPVLAFCGLAVTLAFRAATLPLSFATPPRGLRSLFEVGFTLLPASVRAGWPLALALFLTGLIPLLLGVGLSRFAAFDPGRRASWLHALLKYTAATALVAQTAAHIYYLAAGSALQAYVLAQQTQKPLLLMLLGNHLPHALVEVVALALVLTAPLYWIVRGLQVNSLQRATFEAWVEVRRLAWPAAALLAVAAALEVWATPAITAMILR